MMGRTHLAFGLLTAGLGSLAIDIGGTDLVGLTIGSLLGSLLPDLDHPKSKLGRRFLPLSTFLYATLGHRGGTHSLFFAAVLLLLLIWVAPYLALGLCLGILSHILADMISYSVGKKFTFGNGCPLLWPLARKRFGIRLVTVNGTFEHLVIMPVSFVLGILMLSLSVV